MLKWLGLVAGLAVLVLTGCTKSQEVRCGEVTCPRATHCGPMNECVPDSCGDNRFDSSAEVCDGNESVAQTQLRCSDFGFYTLADDQKPQLTCSETCDIDTSNCRERCGDHTINGPERCDGLPPTGASCADYGFDVGRLGCTEACEPAFDQCTNVGWRILPGGATNELHAVSLTGPSAGVAVGRGGQIIAAKDGVWIPVVSPTTADLNGVFANGAGIVAVGTQGTILRYDGTAITAMASPTNEDLFAISGGAAGAFAVGANGTILQYDNSTWTKLMNLPVGANDHLRAVHVLDAMTAYAVGDGGIVLKWNGLVWTRLNIAGLPTPNLLAVRAFPGGVVFVAGDPPAADPAVVPIARITNDTTVYTPSALPDLVNTAPIRTIWGEPNSLYLGGASGLMLYWNGAFLSAQDSGTDRTIYGLDGVGNRVIAVTRGGSVIGTNGSSVRVDELYPPSSGTYLWAMFTDGVRTVAAGSGLVLVRGADGRWKSISTGPETLTGVWATGTDIWTVEPNVTGSPGHIYRSTGGGAFSLVGSGTGGEKINGIFGVASPLRIVAVGANIWTSTDGTTFTPTNPNGGTMLYDVWGAPDGTFFAVGEGGLVLQRAPGATTWTTLPTGVPNRLLSVWGTSANDVFAVGNFGMILHWDGTAWRRMYTGIAENFVAVSGNSASDVFVSGTGLARMHYDGLSWSRMPSTVTDLDMSSAGGITYHTHRGTIERFTRGDFTKETSCTDAWDNDSDGKTNCDDPDCEGELQCQRGGACETQERVTCDTTQLATSSFSGTARIDSLPCLDHLTPGSEASYRYVAETTGKVTVSITTDDPAAQLDLVVADAAANHCVLNTCRAATRNGATQTVEFQATAGQVFYIVVDGAVGLAYPFTLSLACN